MTFEAVVARVDLRGVVVLDGNGTLTAASVRKRLQDPGGRLGNAIVVGDLVTIETGARPGANTGAVVAHIAPRRNRFERAAAGAQASGRTQVLAANLDQVLAVASLADPVLSEGLLDRFAVTAEWTGLPIRIAFSKIDLVSEDVVQDAMALYRRAGYTAYPVAAKQGSGLEELRSALEGRRTLVVGHSGVGKSTLLNALVPGLALVIGAVNQKTGRGRHTTTASTLLRLGTTDPRTEMIDTPGVRSFGLPPGLSAQDVASLFPEWRGRSGCRFADCSHREEPGCELSKAVEEGAIGEERYRAYLRLYEEALGRVPRSGASADRPRSRARRAAR